MYVLVIGGVGDVGRFVVVNTFVSPFLFFRSSVVDVQILDGPAAASSSASSDVHRRRLSLSSCIINVASL